MKILIFQLNLCKVRLYRGKNDQKIRKFDGLGLTEKNYNFLHDVSIKPLNKYFRSFTNLGLSILCHLGSNISYFGLLFDLLY